MTATIGGMRVSTVGSEAARNVVGGTTAAGILAIALAIISAGLALLDAVAIVQLKDRAAEFVNSGAAVRVLVAQGAVDPASCDRLVGSGSIRAAGALGAAASITPLATPSAPLTAYRVTPGMASLIGVPITGAGVWISTQLARSLGVAVGDALDTSTGTLTVAGTFTWPDDGRDTRFGYAVLEPIPPATAAVDECWAKVWPTTNADDELIRSATFVHPGSTTALSIGQLNNTHGTSLNSEQAFRSRPTRYAAPGSLGAALVLGFFAVRRRRLKYSAARHSGQHRNAQLATALLEVTAWAGVSLVIAAIALVIGLHFVTSPVPRDVLGLVIIGPVLALLGAQLGTVAGVSVVHEDQLFRYFKDR